MTFKEDCFPPPHPVRLRLYLTILSHIQPTLLCIFQFAKNKSVTSQHTTQTSPSIQYPKVSWMTSIKRFIDQKGHGNKKNVDSQLNLLTSKQIRGLPPKMMCNKDRVLVFSVSEELLCDFRHSYDLTIPIPGASLCQNR